MIHKVTYKWVSLLDSLIERYPRLAERMRRMLSPKRL
jgi:hypothetical protein